LAFTKSLFTLLFTFPIREVLLIKDVIRIESQPIVELIVSMRFWVLKYQSLFTKNESQNSRVSLDKNVELSFQ
jgi:hypothetical protein